MASTSEFRNGFNMELDNGLWTIVEFLHVKPGKGPAFVRTKLKNLLSGKVVDRTFPSGFKVTEIRVERRTYQYLYKDDMGYNFMNNETYDQIALEKGKINAPQFLLDGQNVDIVFHAEEEMVIFCELPQYVIQKITYTEPAVKGNTATNATKPATLESGAEVNVPLFIREGDKVRIATADGSYSERVKS